VPIKKENKHKYAKNWKEISKRIRFERAEGRCECEGECGLHTTTGRCIERHGEPARYAKGKIILTVAHLNHDETDCRDENLKAMCQRCHLRYDSKRHKQNSVITRRNKKQTYELFDASQNSA
jgi:hypothetical protein